MTLRFILGDQLARSISALDGIDREADVVLMAEVAAEATHVWSHKQRVAFFLSAMRHFAAELMGEGIAVDYIRLDDPDNSGSLAGELARAVIRHGVTRVIVTAPGEWRVRDALERWRDEAGIALEIREDTRFFATSAQFAAWAKGQDTLRMEFFYREMRRHTGLLMDGDEPIGGRWNFDAANRKRLPAREQPPLRPGFPPDAMTREVLDLVEARFGDHFGELRPFRWAVTRGDALRALDEFIAFALPRFGDVQDAMRRGEPFLYHSILSPYLNVGLLLPREVCARAEQALHEGKAPLNSVEGFIRQILGWREYVRGVYWLHMPAYEESNALGADRALPDFYWSGETDMACIADVVGTIRRHAYAHHIQRLMITGNFALLAGVRPKELEDWYLAVYVDAVDWVELPNTHGMAAFADGGLLASKPYAASGAYIHRMSDYCDSCAYDVAAKTGPTACPFNYLYWAFLLRHAERLRSNTRLSAIYRGLDDWPAERKAATLREADTYLDRVAPRRSG